MSSPDRITRVNEIIKRELADLIEKNSIAPEGCLISVTKVETSVNLRNARVYVSIFGSDEDGKRDILNSLRKYRRDLQQTMSRDVTMKYTPVLEFIQDRNIAEGDRVLSLLKELEEEDD